MTTCEYMSDGPCPCDHHWPHRLPELQRLMPFCASRWRWPPTCATLCPTQGYCQPQPYSAPWCPYCDAVLSGPPGTTHYCQPGWSR